MKKFVAWLFGIASYESLYWHLVNLDKGRSEDLFAQARKIEDLEASLEAEKARSRELADLSLQRGKRIEELEAELHKERNIVLTGDALLKGLDEQVQAQEKVIKEKKMQIRELEAAVCDLTQERDGMRSELKDVKRQHELLHNRLRDIIQLDDEAANTMKARIGELENALSAERARVVEMGKRLKRLESGNLELGLGKMRAMEDSLQDSALKICQRDALIASLEDRLKQAQERIEAEQRCSADSQQWVVRQREEIDRLRNSLNTAKEWETTFKANIKNDILDALEQNGILVERS
jgi:chromosome segregation ATPase